MRSVSLGGSTVLPTLIALVFTLGNGGAGCLKALQTDTLYAVGGRDNLGDITVYQLRDALLLPNGQLVLAQADGIYVFDQAGTQVRRLARKGEGPGEIGVVTALTWDHVSGALLIYDSLLRRITRYFLGGDSIQTRAIPDAGRGITPFARYPLSMGSVLTLESRHRKMRSREFQRAGRRPPQGVWSFEDTLEAVVFDDGGSRRRLASYPMGRQYAVTEGVVTTRMFPPGERRLLYAATGDQVAFTYSDTPDFWILDGADGSTWRGRAEGSPSSMDDDLLERLRDQFLSAEVGGMTIEGRSVGDSPSIRERVVEAAEEPERRPLFDSIHLSESGEVWLRELTLGDSEDAVWQVVVRDGRVRRIALPADLRILSIRGSIVVGRVTDELDVTTVLAIRAGAARDESDAWPD